jgi:ABC-type glycerol-3-phosphate transport system substrate-binding protein
MRKFLLVFCALFLASAMVFGGGGQQSQGTAIGSGKREVKVLWLAGYNQTNVIRDVIEERFVNAHPDIQIIFDEVPNQEVANKAMLEATGKTGAYDVVMVNLGVPALANINALEPLDSLISRDKYPIEKLIDNGITYKGHYYGVSVRGDVRVLHYNAQLFREAGLDPDKPPTTIDQYQEYNKTLTRNGKFGNSMRVNEADEFSSLLFMLGGEVVDSRGEPVFNSPIGVQALEMMVADFKAGYINPNSTGWDYAAQTAQFMTGGSAMWEAWPARYIDAGMPEKSKIVGNQRVAALPGKSSLVSGWCLVMFNTCKDKDAAWEFMKFAVDPTVQKEVILRGGDCNPTHQDVLNDKELQAKYEVLRAVGDSFSKTKIYCMTTQYQKIRSEITEKMGLVFAGTMTPKAALDAAQAEVRRAMVNAGELK